MTKSGPTRKPVAWLLVMGAVLLLAALARLCIGQTIGWPEGSLPGSLMQLSRGALAAVWNALGGNWNVESTSSNIMDLRLLRVLAGGMVGIALATSGVGLQALLRNPLAEPYILGISSGAGVGVMVAQVLGYYLGRFVIGSQLGALIGAAAVAGIVFAASRRRGVLDPLGLLLTGVVLGMVCGGVIMLLNYLIGPAGFRENIARWMMGYLDETTSPLTLCLTAAVILAGWIVLCFHARAMDVATFGDTEAQSLGVNLGRLRVTLFVVSSVLTGAAVVLAGPIAFVGLICPHVARLMLGPKHRPLLLGAAMLGATLILLADMTAALLDQAAHIGILPIGIFTAAIGGPVFLWMLHPQLGRGGE